MSEALPPPSRGVLVASMPMYDIPEVRAATDAWWSGIARKLNDAGVGSVPELLTRTGAQDDTWDPSRLLFSQTCGYPLLTAFRDALVPVLTPCYAVPGCDGPNYSSVIVVRGEDQRQTVGEFRSAVAAVNRRDSQSGYSALRSLVAPLCGDRPFFSAVLPSGRHTSSVNLVALGRADLCAVDCVTYAMLQRHQPAALEGTRVLARSDLAPGLPYVTGARAGGGRVEEIRAAVQAALTDPALEEVRDALFIAGGEVLTLDDYEVLRARETAASRTSFEPLPMALGL